MYKSKLQELCQQKAWRLPEYNVTKQGLDHNPRFSATVTINGLAFNTVESFRSSKQAQNDAARLAFDHFSTPQPIPNSIPKISSFPQPSLLPSSSSTSPPVSIIPAPSTRLGADLSGRHDTTVQLQKTQETHQSPQVSGNTTGVSSQVQATGASSQVSATVASSQVSATGSSSQINGRTSGVEDDNRFKDIQHVYKNQLQHYAQKRNLMLPVYSCEWEGPPHASRFKCTVTIDGRTYQGQDFLPTMKDAEHAAAKVALISLLPNGVQEDDSGLYKNLLQELLQKEGFHAPVYSTRTSGEPHALTFLSTVEIEGESFTGQVARSKKLGELSAAKVAYKTLRERKSSQIPMFPTLASQGQEVSELLSSNAPSNIARPNTPMILIPNLITREQEKESSVAVETSHHPTTGLGTVTASGGSYVSGSVYGCVPMTLPSAIPVSQKGSCSSDRDSTLEPPAKRSTPFSNKVFIHPRMLNTELPEGCTMLPVSDENWVAFSPLK